jgi:hypothetical protein
VMGHSLGAKLDMRDGLARESDVQRFIDSLVSSPLVLYRFKRFLPRICGLNESYSEPSKVVQWICLRYLLFRDSIGLAEQGRRLLRENCVCLHSRAHDDLESQWMDSRIDLAVIGTDKLKVMRLWESEISKAHMRRQRDLSCVKELLPCLGEMVAKKMVDSVALRGSLAEKGRIVVPYRVSYHGVELICPNDNINLVLFVDTTRNTGLIQENISNFLARKAYVRSVVWSRYIVRRRSYSAKYDVRIHRAGGEAAFDFVFYPWKRMVGMYRSASAPAAWFLLRVVEKMNCLLGLERFQEIWDYVAHEFDNTLRERWFEAGLEQVMPD